MPSDLTKLKRHNYSVSFDGRGLGPLVGEPEISIVCRRFEDRSFDPATAGDPGAGRAVIVEAAAEVTIRTGDIGAALELLAGFSVGDDVYAPSRHHALVLAPPPGSGEKTLAFAAACLLPELSYSPKAENHSAKLVFRARPDGTGALFTFSVPAED